MDNKYDVIVLGGGPAGLTAGMYLTRAKVKTLVLNQGSAGGQMVITYKIENFPGFDSISGYALGKNMEKQAKNFGCEVRNNVMVDNIETTGTEKLITLANGDSFAADALILATGGKSRELGVSGENEYKGKGISYCATCDGDFYEGKEIIVVGGGNSALEEAVSLTKYATKVTVIHQFDHFQAYKHAQDEASKHEKIDFMMESRITNFEGEGLLKKVTIENVKTGEITEKPIAGVFIFIGYEPNTEKLQGKVALNKRNEIVTNNQLATSVQGVYAAGDARDTQVRQITTAVSDGTLAALSAIDYLQK